MTEFQTAPAGVLWATRGRTWGFRFLLDGGLADPLAAYEAMFAELGDKATGWVGNAQQVGVRFVDPEGRRDRSGRLIPHDFLVTGDLATQIASVDDALRLLWPLVTSLYARVWDQEAPPSPEDVRFDNSSPLRAD
ncbi:hypothetical protein [Phycicoccus duodecadis]|uniref:Uncharacterized protein n=1 Tax=Phycicoccus duodecadis TaxID=173053 RepID=A0A2N3YFX4_9MICO|nr:hypothetical protein [Phycicoccus duodecadis]PKW25736.1 hypothetical protein ATL31_0536 [Phycicoccus duodecadis]